MTHETVKQKSRDTVFLCPAALHNVPTKFMIIFQIFRIFLLSKIDLSNKSLGIC
jgi:hypothetical protein